MNLAQINLDTVNATGRGIIENTFENYAAPVREQVRKTLPGQTGFSRDSLSGTGPSQAFEKGSPGQYPVSAYKGAGRTFNFHSISPTAAIDDDNYILGIRLKSNNLLNTVSFNAGYNYNISLESGEYTAGFEYKRFYPVLSATYLNRKREGTVRRGQDVQVFNWREPEVEDRKSGVTGKGVSVCVDLGGRRILRNKLQ